MLYLWLVLPFVERLLEFFHRSSASQNSQGEGSGSHGDNADEDEENGEEEDECDESSPGLETLSGPHLTSVLADIWLAKFPALLRLRPYHLYPCDFVTGHKLNTDWFRQALEDMTELGGLGSRVNTEDYWHIANAIMRAKIQNPMLLANIDKIETDEALAGVYDLQANHSMRTSAMIYSRARQELAGSTELLRERFLRASKQWHELLGLTEAKTDVQAATTQLATPSPTRFGKRKLPPTMFAPAPKFLSPFGRKLPPLPLPGAVNAATSAPPEEHPSEQRRRQLMATDPQLQLEKLHGVGAAFRGRQQDGIESILKGESRVGMILPTGRGKSLAFILPASCTPEAVTLIVAPLRSLGYDIVRRCAQYKLTAVLYSD